MRLILSLILGVALTLAFIGESEAAPRRGAPARGRVAAARRAPVRPAARLRTPVRNANLARGLNRNVNVSRNFAHRGNNVFHRGLNVALFGVNNGYGGYGASFNRFRLGAAYVQPAVIVQDAPIVAVERTLSYSVPSVALAAVDHIASGCGAALGVVNYGHAAFFRSGFRGYR